MLSIILYCDCYLGPRISVADSQFPNLPPERQTSLQDQGNVSPSPKLHSMNMENISVLEELSTGAMGIKLIKKSTTCKRGS